MRAMLCRKFWRRVLRRLFRFMKRGIRRYPRPLRWLAGQGAGRWRGRRPTWLGGPRRNLSSAPRAASQAGHRASRKLVTFPHNPVACNSHTQTTTTTRTFRIVLILEAMGMYRLIRYNATPTIINTTTRFTKGIFVLLQSRKEQSVAHNAQAASKLAWRALCALAWPVKAPGPGAACGSHEPTCACQMIEYGQTGSAVRLRREANAPSESSRPPASGITIPVTTVPGAVKCLNVFGISDRNRSRTVRGSVTGALISQGLLSRERKRAGAFPKTFKHPRSGSTLRGVVTWCLAAVLGFQLFAGYFRREPISSLRRPWLPGSTAGKV